MAMYGAFSSAMMGMMVQSTALDNIGSNIANIGTSGYKKTDTRFATVLSNNINAVSDLGGVKPLGIQRIDLGGSIVASSRNLDTAISGKGFYVLNTKRDGSGETFYTRDGSFETVNGDDISVLADDGVSTITSQESYLVDKNGHYVMAWQPQGDGTFNTASKMAAMRVDAYAFQGNGIATTQATLDMNLPSGDAADSSYRYNVQVYDSNGTARTIALSFVKDTTLNTWTVTPSWTDGPTTAQEDTVALTGSVEKDDVYSVTVNGTTVSYTATGGEASMTEIRDNLLALVTANTAISGAVTAAASGASDITLTANVAGTAFTSTAATTQALTNVARQDTVTLSGAIVPGDDYQITIGATTFSVTAGGGDTLETLRDQLLSDINTHTPADPSVAATANGTDGINLVADAAGTDFTLTTFTSGGGAVAITNVATNYTALTDNTAADTTTIANVGSNVTGTPTTLTFNGDGELVSPTTLTLSATWADGGTSATALDISEMSQFAGEYSPYTYWQNGYGTGQLREISFDAHGQVQGQFTNTQTRALYRMGLAVFTNANGLEMVNGNLFKTTEESGEANIIAPGQNSYGTISGNAREMSNVNVADEFSNMIVTQQAYNSAATIFRTVDEMTTTARDLKK